MNATVAEAMLVMAASEIGVGAEVPCYVYSALCAVNMLLLLDIDLLESRSHHFADFLISPVADRTGARVSFVGKNAGLTDVIVERSALHHLKTVGNFRALRLCQRAKL